MLVAFFRVCFHLAICARRRIVALIVNTKQIEDALKKQASKLAKGNDKQKAFGDRVHSLALEIEKDREDSEKPFTPEMLKESQVDLPGSHRQKPRHLKPQDMRMWNKQ